MARRRNVNLNAVPVPKPAKIARPQGKVLREIYKGLITLSASNRINSLTKALQWYDSALLYMLSRTKGQPLSAEVQKALERAVKMRKIGMSATAEGEKEAAFFQAVKQYEKAHESLSPFLVDKVYAQYEARKAKLEQKQQTASQKFGPMLAQLSTAIGNEVRLLVFDSPKVKQIVPQSKEVIYNRDGARQIVDMIRQQGLLAAFAAESPTLAKCLAFETDGNGGFQVSAEKYIAAQERLIKNFVVYAGTADAPNRLVKLGANAQLGQLPTPKPPVQRSNVPATPRVPGQRGPSKGPKVYGHYAQGSSMAMLLERLQDQQEKKVADLLVGIPASSPMGRLEALTKEVKRYGIGEIIWKGKETVQMKLAQGVV